MLAIMYKAITNDNADIKNATIKDEPVTFFLMTPHTKPYFLLQLAIISPYWDLQDSPNGAIIMDFPTNEGGYPTVSCSYWLTRVACSP